MTLVIAAQTLFGLLTMELTSKPRRSSAVFWECYVMAQECQKAHSAERHHFYSRSGIGWLSKSKCHLSSDRRNTNDQSCCSCILSVQHTFPCVKVPFLHFRAKRLPLKVHIILAGKRKFLPNSVLLTACHAMLASHEA